MLCSSRRAGSSAALWLPCLALALPLFVTRVSAGEAHPIFAGGMSRIAVSGMAALSAGALDEQGLIVAVGDRSGRVALIELATGRVVKTVEAHRGEVRALCFGQGLLYSGGEGGRVYAWEDKGRGQRRRVRRRGKPIRDLDVSARYLAVAAEQSTIELYELKRSGRGRPRMRRLKGHRGWVRTLSFTSAGDMLASGGHDGKIRIWSTKTRRVVQKLSGHELWVTALAFGPEGRRLASAGFDKKVNLWEVGKKKPLRQLKGHIRVVVDLTFDRAGQRLASAGLDRRAMIWDPTSGRILSQLDGHSYQVSAVAFSPPGDLLVTAAGDGFLRLWSLPQRAPDVLAPLEPPGPGEVTLRQNTTGERVRVRLLDGRGRVAKRARRELARIMRSRPDGRISLPDARLVRLLYKVADHFGREHEVIVVSGYRSPQYNRLRRRQSRQVAKKSQHLNSSAIDVRIDGVTITALHRYIKGLEAGGVGFYPDSKFVHMDTGPVRSWEGN